MKFAVAVLACALAVANAQFNRNNNFGFGNQGQYRPGQYQQGQYQQGQNQNRYQPFNNRYQPFNNKPYKPFVSSTPFPVKPAVAKASAFVQVNPTPYPVAPVAPVVPVVPFTPVTPVVAARVAADARSAETLKSGYEINPDGSYSHFFETNNGIAAQAQGTPRNFGGNPPVVPDVAQGSFSWVTPEGKTISVTYTADENGYQPQSDALPVPPPVPAQIARALEYAARYNAKN